MEITKWIMQQYEIVRRSGAVNMFNMSGVANVAAQFGFDELEEVANDREQYMDLLKNFSSYMREFGVVQDG